jgi:hypothetical protein
MDEFEEWGVSLQTSMKWHHKLVTNSSPKLAKIPGFGDERKTEKQSKQRGIVC